MVRQLPSILISSNASPSLSTETYLVQITSLSPNSSMSPSIRVHQPLLVTPLNQISSSLIPFHPQHSFLFLATLPMLALKPPQSPAIPSLPLSISLHPAFVCPQAMQSFPKNTSPKIPPPLASRLSTYRGPELPSTDFL